MSIISFPFQHVRAIIGPRLDALDAAEGRLHGSPNFIFITDQRLVDSRWGNDLFLNKSPIIGADCGLCIAGGPATLFYYYY